MTVPQPIPDLLDRELTEEDRREWTDRVASEVQTAEPATASSVIFRIGREWLGLSTFVFEGITEPSPVHSLPRRRESPGLEIGLVNVQGELLVALSLGAMLGVLCEPAGDVDGRRISKRTMIVSDLAGRLAFPVDEVYGVHRFRPAELRDLPATLSNAPISYTLGILLWQGRSVAQLDDALLLSAITRALS
jgi:chemotaxis-related protein WspD